MRGKPHATFDVAGAGNEMMAAGLRATAKAVEQPPEPDVGHRQSPTLPTLPLVPSLLSELASLKPKTECVLMGSGLAVLPCKW